KLFTDREAQSCSAILTILGSIPLIKSLKDRINSVWRNPDACVLYSKIKKRFAFVAVSTIHLHLNMPLMREFDCVHGEINQYLPNPVRVTQEKTWRSQCV